jgi:large subunit ribosomal protein L25
MFATSQNELLLHLEHESFYTHILTLKLDGKEETVVLKDLQRHPAKPFIMHLDLLRVSKKDKIKMTVPFHFVNEETCHGIKMQGGAASHLMNDVEIICAAQDLPEFIEVDMAKLEMDQTIHLSEVKLPKGVEIVALTHGEEHDTGVVSIHKPKVQAVEEEAPAADAEEEKKED